jgi:hypothetical protein
MNPRRTAVAASMAKSLAAIALVFTLSDRADACQCVSISPCQALSVADTVFTGIVTDISPVLTPDGNGITGSAVTLVADRSFVGATAGPVVL